MKLKKVNAIFAFILSLLFIAHLVTMSILLFGINSLKVLAIIGKFTSLVAIVHAILSIIALIRIKIKKDENKYSKINRTTHVQRFSAIVILVLMEVHIQVFSLVIPPVNLSLGLKIIATIIEALFFEMCCCHMSISFPKMLISLGIAKSEEKYKTICTIWSCFSSALLVLSIISLLVFIWR